MFDPGSPMHEVGNIVEAVLWGGIALVLAGRAFFLSGDGRRTSVIASVFFALFGLSDVVEVSTEAWWRPWWLLAWKELCIGVLAWLLFGHYRRKRSVGSTVSSDSTD